jgi:hypothetical protein
MWQPNRAQWGIIWAAALLLILSWPPAEGRSLMVKAANWMVDGSPDGFAPPRVTRGSVSLSTCTSMRSDPAATEYYRQYESSAVTRWRMQMKEAGDPLSVQTERQILVGVGVVAALMIWRLQRRVGK